MLIFSDIHYGVSNDSESKLKDADGCIDWICKVGKERSEDMVAFLGDFMHDKSYINVLTAETVKNAIKKLSENFKLVLLIVGNHDIYYNDKNEVNSLKLFEHIADNVVVIEKPKEISVDGKKGLLCPWGFDPADHNDIYDFMLGHFAFSGARMNGRTSSGKYSPSDLTSLSKLVFSGHYHLTSQIDVGGGSVISIGSPYQIDWGDADDEKRIIILNTKTLEWESVLNVHSPKHIKLNYASMKDVPKEKASALFGHPSMINNHVKLIVDGEVDYELLKTILEDAKSSGTSDIEPDYVLSNIKAMKQISEGIEKSASKNLKDYVYEAIDEATKSERFGDINSDDLKKKVDFYFDKVIINSK